MRQIRKAARAARKALKLLPAEIYEFKKQVPRQISSNFHDNKYKLDPDQARVFSRLQLPDIDSQDSLSSYMPADLPKTPKLFSNPSTPRYA